MPASRYRAQLLYSAWIMASVSAWIARARWTYTGNVLNLLDVLAIEAKPFPQASRHNPMAGMERASAIF